MAPLPTRLPEQRRLDIMTRLGGGIFVVGFVAAIAIMVPYFTGGAQLPTAAYLVAMAAPVGLAVVLFGLVSAARTRARRYRDQR